MGTYFYTIERSTMHQLIKQREHVKGRQTYDNPEQNDDDSDAAEERGHGCQLYKG